MLTASRTWRAREASSESDAEPHLELRGLVAAKNNIVVVSPIGWVLARGGLLAGEVRSWSAECLQSRF